MDREAGLRRSVALTLALIGASIAGATGVGIAAYASEKGDTTATTSDSTSSDNGTSDSPAITGGDDDSGQVTSGGS